MSERDQLRRSWVANASAWSDAVREQQIESRRLVTDAAVIEAVLAQAPRRVLDVGCGEGWLARALAERGIDVTGVDASAPLIEAARASGGGQFIIASYEDIAADPGVVGGPFDVVVANFSLLDDRAEEIVASFRRTLVAGGKLIVQTVHPAFAVDAQGYVDGWRVETFEAFSGEWVEAMPWYFRTIGSWSRLFAAAGYTLLEIREPHNPVRNVPASLLFICGV